MAESTDNARQLIHRCLKARRAVVLGLMGPNYCGKSKLCDDVTAYLSDRRIPHAAVDPEELAVGTVSDLLDQIVAGFTASPTAYGRVRFRRYLLARSVLAMRIPAGDRESGPPPDVVEAAVRRKLRSGWRRDALLRVADALTAPIARMLFGVAGALADMLRALLAALVDPLLHTLPAWLLRPGARWFAKNSRLGPARTPEAALMRLWLSHQGGQRELVLSTLVAAFLADLRSSPRWRSFPGRWTGSYALLIDNAERTPGDRLVRLLVQELTGRDRLTVVATHRGGLLAAIGAVAGVEAVTSAARVPVADQHALPSRETRWWPVRLPDLDLADVRDQVRTATGWQEAACAAAAVAVHRFTRGHPGATALVVAALANRPAPRGSLDLDDVVDDALRADLLDHLLGRFAGQGATVRALETCAAVRDREHVAYLVGHGITEAHQGTVQSDELWVPGRAGRLVLLPVLRTLLLDGLARRAPDEPGGWNRVFAALAEQAGGDDAESRLYYLLAQGETETVTRELWDRLNRAHSGEDWLRLIKHVTLAPGRFRTRRGAVAADTLREWARAEPDRLEDLAILVVRLWHASDPRVVSEIEANEIADRYGRLADRFTAVGDALRVEAARWRAAGSAASAPRQEAVPPVGFPRPATVRAVRWSSRFGAVAVLILLLGLYGQGLGGAGCAVQRWRTGRPCDLWVSSVPAGGRTETIGVTDSVAFRPEYADAMRTLRKQNDAALKGPYVTVAVAGPMSDGDPRDLHRLEGAIAGQHDANLHGKPYIRLVIANMGARERYWAPIARSLRDDVDGEGHLRAVAGMGLSQVETTKAMDEVWQTGVPIISDMTTADTIHATATRPFVRIGPHTGQQLYALGRYLRPRLAGHKAMLVESSDPKDLYTQALTHDFKRYLNGPLDAGGADPLTFGADRDHEFDQIVRLLCGRRGIDTIYYAGRAADLPAFLWYVGRRPGCAQGTITVITTSDTSRLLAATPENQAVRTALSNSDRPTDLLFTSLADRGYLEHSPATGTPGPRLGAHTPMGMLHTTFTQLGFPLDDLDTGWAIMEHDAIVTAAEAVRNAGSGGIPRPSAVASMLRYMPDPGNAVQGASGAVTLDPVTGNRRKPVVPVLRFVPKKGAAPQLLATYSPE